VLRQHDLIHKEACRIGVLSRDHFSRHTPVEKNTHGNDKDQENPKQEEAFNLQACFDERAIQSSLGHFCF
jgi:hypothetical protein